MIALKKELREIYRSLADQRKTEIQEEVLRRALDRERDRDNQIETIEARKQAIIHELEHIEWTAAENDQWFQDVKNNRSLFSEGELQSRVAIAYSGPK